MNTSHPTPTHPDSPRPASPAGQYDHARMQRDAEVRRGLLELFDSGLMLPTNAMVRELAAALRSCELERKRLADEVRQFREMWQQNEAPFHEWAQTYLDAGRWAGHPRSDAIKTELLERDQALAALRAEVEELRKDRERLTHQFGKERPAFCPQCGDPVIQMRDGDDYCENCGWPDEHRPE